MVHSCNSRARDMEIGGHLELFGQASPAYSVRFRPMRKMGWMFSEKQHLWLSSGFCIRAHTHAHTKVLSCALTQQYTLTHTEKETEKIQIH